MIYVPFWAALSVNPASGGWTHLRSFGFNSLHEILTLDLDGSLHGKAISVLIIPSGTVPFLLLIPRKPTMSHQNRHLSSSRLRLEFVALLFSTEWKGYIASVGYDGTKL
jgi:hypothetical protein